LAGANFIATQLHLPEVALHLVFADARLSDPAWKQAFFTAGPVGGCDADRHLTLRIRW